MRGTLSSYMYFFPYYITSFPNLKLNYVFPLCIVIFSFIYCSSTLSGEHINCQEICTYITLCKFRQESRYNPYLFIYVCYRCICKYFRIKIRLHQCPWRIGMAYRNITVNRLLSTVYSVALALGITIIICFTGCFTLRQTNHI